MTNYDDPKITLKSKIIYTPLDEFDEDIGDEDDLVWVDVNNPEKEYRLPDIFWAEVDGKRYLVDVRFEGHTTIINYCDEFIHQHEITLIDTDVPEKIEVNVEELIVTVSHSILEEIKNDGK